MADELDPIKPGPKPAQIRRRDRERIAAGREIMEGVGTGKITRAESEAAVAKTRRAMRAVSPIVTEALLDKALRGRRSPVDTKAAMFLLTASGVSQPGAPVTEEERRKIEAEMDALEATSREDLSRRIHETIGLAPLPEPEA